MKRIRLAERELPRYTRREELANMWTHMTGVWMGVAVIALCFMRKTLQHGGYSMAGGVVFGATMVLLYTISSVYHGLPGDGTGKKVMQVLDHCTIFALIAGTYTPITLCAIRAHNLALGWVMFGVVWAAAIVGIVLNAIDLKRYKKFSMVCYLALGWCVVLTFRDIVQIFGTKGVAYLLGGGVAYTVGTVFYRLGKNIPYMHTVFHVFCLLGSALHAVLVLWYVI